MASTDTELAQALSDMLANDDATELNAALEAATERGHEHSAVDGWQTFEQAGILTSNQGLVLTMNDGSEYQLTLVRSR